MVIAVDLNGLASAFTVVTTFKQLIEDYISLQDMSSTKPYVP